MKVDITEDDFLAKTDDYIFSMLNEYWKARKEFITWVDGDRNNTDSLNIAFTDTLVALKSWGMCMGMKDYEETRTNSDWLEGVPPFMHKWAETNLYRWNPRRAASAKNTPQKQTADLA